MLHFIIQEPDVRLSRHEVKPFGGKILSFHLIPIVTQLIIDNLLRVVKKLTICEEAIYFLQVIKTLAVLVY